MKQLGILGAGVMGCALAWYCRRHFRVEVTLWERRKNILPPYPLLPIPYRELVSLFPEVEKIEGEKQFFPTQRLLFWLWQDAVQQGVQFFFSSSFLSISKKEEKWCVVTEQGEQHLDFLCVVLDSQSWSLEVDLTFFSKNRRLILYGKPEREKEVSSGWTWQWESCGHLCFLVSPLYKGERLERERTLQLGRKLLGGKCLGVWEVHEPLSSPVPVWQEQLCFFPSLSLPLLSLQLALGWGEKIGEALELKRKRQSAFSPPLCPFPASSFTLCRCVGCFSHEAFFLSSFFPSIEELLSYFQVPLQGCGETACVAKMVRYLARRGIPWSRESGIP